MSNFKDDSFKNSFKDNTSFILDLIPTLTFPSFEDVQFSSYKTFTLVDCPFLSLYIYTTPIYVKLVYIYGTNSSEEIVYKSENNFEGNYSKLCFRAIYWYRGAFTALIDGAQLNKG